MNDICNDNREILITKYYEKLIEETNIETSYDEMQVLKNILFRMWQLGWLDVLERSAQKHEQIERREEAIPEGYVKVVRCKDCAYYENCLDTYMIPADCCPQGKRKEETE